MPDDDKKRINLYAREVPYYLANVRMYKLIVRKSIKIVFDGTLQEKFNQVVIEDFYYLVKKKGVYYVFFYDTKVRPDLKSPLCLFKKFNTTLDPLTAVTSFKDVGSPEFYSKYYDSEVKATSYKSYLGKNRI